MDFESLKSLGWFKLLPGFTWIGWPSFFLGIIETFGYGIYFGLKFAPLSNFFHDRFVIRKGGES